MKYDKLQYMKYDKLQYVVKCWGKLQSKIVIWCHKWL